MENEFKQTVEMINSCIGSVNAEVNITPDEGLYADVLYYRCKEYMKAYDNHQYWESRFRR